MTITSEKRNVADLPPVAHTLLAPLACRALESARQDGLIRDRRAEDVYARLGNLADSVPQMGAMDRLFTVMRARQFDHYARNFLAVNPQGLVVDIGCGLDTRFDRVDNGSMSWLGLDLPEVIALRQSLLPDPPRCETLASSAFDLAWLDVVAQKHKPVIFLAEGVFCYFPEADVKRLIMAMSMRFPGAELAFDAISPFSIWLHNRNSSVLKETGARLNWGVGDPQALEAWGMRLVEKWRYFDKYEPRLSMANWLKYLPIVGDMNYILYYRFNAPTE